MGGEFHKLQDDVGLIDLDIIPNQQEEINTPVDTTPATTAPVPIEGSTLKVTILEASLPTTATGVGSMLFPPRIEIRVGHSALLIDRHDRSTPPNYYWANQTISFQLTRGVDSVTISVLDKIPIISTKLLSSTNIIIPQRVFQGETVDRVFRLSSPGMEAWTARLILSFIPYQPPQVIPGRPNYRVTEEDIVSMQSLFPDIGRDTLHSILSTYGGNRDMAAAFIMDGH